MTQGYPGAYENVARLTGYLRKRTVSGQALPRIPSGLTPAGATGIAMMHPERRGADELQALTQVSGLHADLHATLALFASFAALYKLTANLPTGSRVYGDKGDNSSDDEAWLEGEWGIHLVPVRRKNMTPNSAEERGVFRQMWAAVEGANSQLVAWGVQRLHARTTAGVAIKVLASLLALAVVNA